MKTVSRPAADNLLEIGRESPRGKTSDAGAVPADISHVCAACE
ncbi:hypothetical protein X759_22560 [Mesorhizobium sp. LSHC420B00]|nr:hypothetical protein X759_22560 [Mesorhizobium sp. LSHC420B00]